MTIMRNNIFTYGENRDIVSLGFWNKKKLINIFANISQVS